MDEIKKIGDSVAEAIKSLNDLLKESADKGVTVDLGRESGITEEGRGYWFVTGHPVLNLSELE